MRLFCPVCSAEYLPGQKYCEGCGLKIQSIAEKNAEDRKIVSLKVIQISIVTIVLLMLLGFASLTTAFKLLRLFILCLLCLQAIAVAILLYLYFKRKKELSKTKSTYDEDINRATFNMAANSGMAGSSAVPIRYPQPVQNTYSTPQANEGVLDLKFPSIKAANSFLRSNNRINQIYVSFDKRPNFFCDRTVITNVHIYAHYTDQKYSMVYQLAEHEYNNVITLKDDLQQKIRNMNPHLRILSIQSITHTIRMSSLMYIPVKNIKLIVTFLEDINDFRPVRFK